MEQNETAVKQAFRAYLHAGIQGYAAQDASCAKDGAWHNLQKSLRACRYIWIRIVSTELTEER